METAARPLHLSVDDYLKFETDAPVRHEYVAGIAHPMADNTLRHNLIAGNVASAFHCHLRGGPCRTYMITLKLRLMVNLRDVFYYPDVMVACTREGAEEYYLRYPKLIVEVLSESTESIDRREKLLNYPTISTLAEYILIAQDAPDITLHRRETHWRPTVLTAKDAKVEFPSLKLSLPLAQIYEGVL